MKEIYSEELLANCYWETGDKDAAVKLWKSAKERLGYEIEQAVDLRDGIMKRLSE